MNIVTTPERYPYHCHSCRCGSESPGRDWFVDFGDLDNQTPNGPDYATVYICSMCFLDVAVKQGFTTPEKSAELNLRILSLEADLFEARRKADELETGLNALLRARFIAPTDAAKLGWVLEDHQDNDEQSSSEGGGLAPGAGASNEQGDVEGVADLRSDVIGDDDSAG